MLTVGIVVDRDHAPEFGYAKSRYLFGTGGIVCVAEDSTLYDTVNAFIQKGHCGRGPDKVHQGHLEFAYKTWLQRRQGRKLG